jgi:2Fe-2S ferredoxin
MPRYKVAFEPAHVTVEVDCDQFPFGRTGEAGSILDIALTHGVEIDHACGGVAVCGTCHVIVEKGMENLSPPSEDEQDHIDELVGGTLSSRLACQAVVRGDVTVRIP